MTLPNPDPTLAPRPEASLDQPTLLEAARGYVDAAKVSALTGMDPSVLTRSDPSASALIGCAVGPCS